MIRLGNGPPPVSDMQSEASEYSTLPEVTLVMKDDSGAVAPILKKASI